MKRGLGGVDAPRAATEELWLTVEHVRAGYNSILLWDMLARSWLSRQAVLRELISWLRREDEFDSVVMAAQEGNIVMLRLLATELQRTVSSRLLRNWQGTWGPR